MSLSALASSNLCSLQRTSLEGNKVICRVPSESTTALVIYLISLSFLATGIYLLLSGIGTIPALSWGSSLLVAGTGLLIFALFMTFQSIKR